MGDARLRPSPPGEADAVADLQAASATVAFAHIFGDEPFPLERTRRRWRSFRGQVVVAEESGRIVGFVAFGEQELDALYVHPERWGRGIGDRLLAAAGSASALWVIEANTRARRFYERRGWRPDGSTQVVFGVREVRYRRDQAPMATRLR
jgi:GNAT superfamily N-acetyltransferase